MTEYEALVTEWQENPSWQQASVIADWMEEVGKDTELAAIWRDRATKRKEYEDDVARPGKFQGQPAYVPYLWSSDWGPDTYGPDDTCRYEIAPEDRELFPELVDVDHVFLMETNSGFVREVNEPEESGHFCGVYGDEIEEGQEIEDGHGEGGYICRTCRDYTT